MLFSFQFTTLSIFIACIAVAVTDSIANTSTLEMPDNVLLSDVLMENSTIAVNQTDSSTVLNGETTMDSNTLSTRMNITAFFENKMNDALNLYNFSIAENSSCIQPVLDSSLSLQGILTNLNSSIDDAIGDLTLREKLTPIFDMFNTNPQFDFENGVKQNLTRFKNDVSIATKDMINDLLYGDTFSSFKLFQNHIFSTENGTIRPIFEKTLTMNVTQLFAQDSECYQIVNDIDKNLNQSSVEFVNGLRDECVTTYATNTSICLDDCLNALTEIFSMIEMTVGRLMTELLPELKNVTAEDLEAVSMENRIKVFYKFY